MSRSREVGNFLVKSLPSDAWEKWCKDGAVCFAYNGLKTFKIFFANPIDLSIYHVVDFFHPHTRSRSTVYTVGCTLVGSKIYVLCGYDYEQMNCLDDENPYVAVHYCDVANHQLPGGGYEWKRGPDLITHKHSPLVFNLAGKIYVLSLGFDCCKPFEVLGHDDKWDKWELLLDVPYMVTLDQTMFVGSFVYEDGKRILIGLLHLPSIAQFLLIYDTESNSWDAKKVNSPCYTFPLKEFDLFLDKSFVINGRTHELGSAILKPLGLMNVGSLRCPKPRKKAKEGKERIRQRGDIYPYYWHILPLGNEKFCLLSLYADQISDHDGLNPYWKYYVRFGTFGLVDDALSGRSPCPSKPLMPSKPLSRGFPQSTPSTPKNQIQKGKAPSRGFQSKTTPKKQIWVQKGKAPFQSNTQFLSSPETTPKNQTQKEKAPGGRVEIASPSKEYRMKNLKIKYIDIAVQKKKLELLPYSIVCSKIGSC